MGKPDTIGGGQPTKSSTKARRPRASPSASGSRVNKSSYVAENARLHRLERAAQRADAGLRTNDGDGDDDNDDSAQSDGSDTFDESDIPTSRSYPSSGPILSKRPWDSLNPGTVQALLDQNESLFTTLSRSECEIKDLKHRLSVAEHPPNSREIHLKNDNEDLRLRLQAAIRSEATLENGLRIMEDRHCALQAQMEHMTAEIGDLKQSLRIAQDHLATSDAEKARLETQNAELVARLRATEERPPGEESLRAENADLQQRLRAADDNRFELRELRQRAWSAEDSLASEIAEKKEMEKQHKRALAKVQKESDRFLDESTKQELEVMMMRAKLKKRDEEIENIRRQRQMTLTFADSPASGNRSTRI